MKDNWEKAFLTVLVHEGGYVNHPKDPGGCTNMGVTKNAWELYLGKRVTEDDMKALTVEMIKPFYKKMYWDKIKGDQLPSGVDIAAFDFAVNSGVSKSSRVMQEIAGVTQDGVIGPRSLEAILAVPPEEMIDAITMTRLEFLKRLPTWDTFGKGWSKRVEQVEKYANSLA